MLLRFIVDNFGSIKDHCEFSMVAGRGCRHPTHVNEILGKRILRSSFIFGANAGGKSTFFRAMGFAVDVIRKGIKRVDCSNRAFRLTDCPKDEGVFQFDFIQDGHLFSYGFVVSYSAVSIIAEWLYLCEDGKNDICLFNRERRGDRVCLETDLREPKVDSQWMTFFRDDFVAGDTSQVLVLNDLSRRAVQGNKLVEFVVSAKAFFKRFVMIAPDDVYGQGIYMQCNPTTQSELEAYLRRFDTGITKIVPKELDYDEVSVTLPPYIRDNLQHDFAIAREESRKRARVSATVTNNKKTYFFDFVDGKIRVRKLFFEHGKQDVLFERLEESDGTRRLFDLLPLLLLLKSGQCIVFVDEIDRSLHTKATEEFVKLFFQQEPHGGSQLLATTHDGELLNLDLLRQDEIWFVERDNHYVSRLYPLTKFKARFNSEVKKDYLLGRYGALPIFGRLGEVEE